MEDDTVDASTYVFKPMSLGFEVSEEQAEQVRKIKVDHATAATISAVGTAINSKNIASVTSKGLPVATKPFEADPTQEMLNDMSSPYNIEPTTLVNLWAVRFGKGWVGLEAVANAEEAEFWRHTTNRLRELGCIEMHTLASSYRVVLRIVE